MTHATQQLNDIADRVIKGLSREAIIHRYDSYTTNSIYLKFDYGVANSLRISDHPGKQHLRYRFNLMLSQAGTPHYQIIKDGFVMHFYPPEELDELIRRILIARKAKVDYYTSYDAVIKKAKSEIDKTKGFWRGAVRVR